MRKINNKLKLKNMSRKMRWACEIPSLTEKQTNRKNQWNQQLRKVTSFGFDWFRFGTYHQNW